MRGLGAHAVFPLRRFGDLQSEYGLHVPRKTVVEFAMNPFTGNVVMGFQRNEGALDCIDYLMSQLADDYRQVGGFREFLTEVDFRPAAGSRYCTVCAVCNQTPRFDGINLSCGCGTFGAFSDRATACAAWNAQPAQIARVF